MIWLRQQQLAWASAFRRLLGQPFATLFTSLALGVAISLPLGLHLALATLERVAGDLPAQPELSVYLAADADQASRRALEKRIRSQPEVVAVRFVDKDEALKALTETQGLADVAAGLDANPLPDAWVVHAREPAQLAALRDAFVKQPGVAEVQLDNAWLERLAAARALGATLVWLAAALFGVALVAVSANAIRAQVLARRDEIQVSRLIGASTRYIRRPFLYTGALQGLLGGLAAWSVLSVAALLVSAPLARFAALYGAQWALLPPAPAEVGGALAVAALLGGLGAWIAVGRALRQVEAET